MMKVRWFEEHSENERIMQPTEIWNGTFYKPFGTSYKLFGPALFMPIVWIHQLYVACSVKLETEETVMAINPTIMWHDLSFICTYIINICAI